MTNQNRMVAWKSYEPLKEMKYIKYYEIYKEFEKSMLKANSDTLHKEYSRMKNKYESRILVWLWVITQAKYNTMTF